MPIFRIQYCVLVCTRNTRKRPHAITGYRYNYHRQAKFIVKARSRYDAAEQVQEMFIPKFDRKYYFIRVRALKKKGHQHESIFRFNNLTPATK